MKIAFIGYGNVGLPLAGHLQHLGHNVVLATRNPESASVKKALNTHPNLNLAPTEEAIRDAEVVFLATPFSANQAILEPLKEALKGKILVDCTNPVGAGLTHGLNNTQSGSEFVQNLLPETAVVKAFSIYGYENFQNNQFPQYGIKPVMMYCGDEPSAKDTVGELIAQLGWEPLDVGGLLQALHLEHMTLLWVRMVRAGGKNPHMVWAALSR